MAKRTTSVTIGTQTYTVGDTVHYQFCGEGVVEDILVRIIKHRKGTFARQTYSFIMADGTLVFDDQMIESCGQEAVE